MRIFDYRIIPDELINYEMMNLVSAIHEYKGKQELFVEAMPDVLKAMLEIAKIQSTGASNRIEGIRTSDERLKALMKQKVKPRNRSEQEIVGYWEVLGLIHDNYDYMVPRTNLILQLHKDLYRFNPSSVGGRFKNSDNVIEEIDADGARRVRFKTVLAFETPDAVEHLAAAFLEAIDSEKYDPLILIPMFILDFLCIHPFNDGNGRLSRLLTLLLLYRSGYLVGKYISIEMVIEKTKETYYEVLHESSELWYDNQKSYLPFIRYYLQIILSAYKDFSERVELIQDRSMSKPQRIRKLFEKSVHKMSKSMIMEIYPDISMSTVEATLALLLKKGYIVKIGAGKNTAYIRNTANKDTIFF